MILKSEKWSMETWGCGESSLEGNIGQYPRIHLKPREFGRRMWEESHPRGHAWTVNKFHS